MGKNSKKKLKWKNIESAETKETDSAPSSPHPFLKIFSKNMDAIIRRSDTCSTHVQQESTVHKDVLNPALYTGNPLQYVSKNNRRLDINSNIHTHQLPNEG